MNRVEIGSWRRHAQISSLLQCCRWARWRQAHMESPKNHIELVTEIIPPGRSRCFAKCEMQNVSGVSRAEPDILFNFRRPQICLFCMRISDVIRPSVCNPRYSGEYIINYISLLIISIRLVSFFYFQPKPLTDKIQTQENHVFTKGACYSKCEVLHLLRRALLGYHLQHHHEEKNAFLHGSPSYWSTPDSSTWESKHTLTQYFIIRRTWKLFTTFHYLDNFVANSYAPGREIWNHQFSYRKNMER